MNPNTKELIVNLSIGLVVVVFGLVVYFVFLKEGSSKVKQALTREADTVATETIMLGAEVDKTITELKTLNSVVVGMKEMLSSPGFLNLKDFSVLIPEEAIGRQNPFVPTLWKLEALAKEEQARKINRAVIANPL